MKKSISAVIALFASTAALAATQGNVGDSTSSGTVGITLDVNTSIVAKNFNDMSLSLENTAPGSDIVGSEPFCVGGLGFNEYTIAFSSLNGSTGSGTATDAPFELESGADQIAYQVGFADSVGATTPAASADSNGDVSSQYAKNGDLGCGTDNAKLFVTIPSSEWEAATQAADYSDTLTVTVTVDN